MTTQIPEQALVMLAKKVVAATTPKHVTPAILLAVIMQESSGVAFFFDTGFGSLFKMNIFGAMKYRKKKADGTFEIIYTGLREGQIRTMATIGPTVGKYIVNKLIVGNIAKFRFEPAYWERFAHLPIETRFIFSCSWGLPQFMGPNINRVLDETGAEYIKQWRADLSMQLTSAVHFIDNLLEHSHGDVNKMYRGYNSGDINSANPDVIYRANAVEKAANLYQIQIGE